MEGNWALVDSWRNKWCQNRSRQQELRWEGQEQSTCGVENWSLNPMAYQGLLLYHALSTCFSLRWGFGGSWTGAAQSALPIIRTACYEDLPSLWKSDPPDFGVILMPNFTKTAPEDPQQAIFEGSAPTARAYCEQWCKGSWETRLL